MNPIILKLIIGALIALILVGGGAFGGYTFEHDKMVKLEADLNAKVAIQTAAVLAVNKTVKDNENEASTNLVTSVNAVHAYYAAHPVRVLSSANCSALSSTTGNSQVINGASSVPDATTLYASPYSPPDTEDVAVRLDALQKLLVKDGVTVQ